MRLGALSDELSDNEFAPQGALGLRGKCFGETQLGFHQPQPPRQYKNSPGQAGSDPQAWPNFAAPCPGERLRVASFPESGFRNLALLFGRLFVDWPGLSCLEDSLPHKFPAAWPCREREGVRQEDPHSLCRGPGPHWGLITGHPVTRGVWVDGGPWTQGREAGFTLARTGGALSTSQAQPHSSEGKTEARSRKRVS